MAYSSYAAITIADSPLECMQGIDNSTTEVGGVDVSDQLEIHSFTSNITMGSQLSHGSRGTSEMVFEPCTLVCSMGKAAPYLAQALYRNQNIGVTLKMFGRDHETGLLEHTDTVTLGNARIVGFRLIQANTHDENTSTLPNLVEVKIAAHTYGLTSEKGGSECLFEWGNRT